MLMFKSTHRRAMRDVAALLNAGEFSGAPTLVDKVGLALARLEEHRAAQFRNRQKALTCGTALAEALKERDTARAALAEIAAMETPGSANIGRRMAARARQELPGKPGSAPVRAAMETA